MKSTGRRNSIGCLATTPDELTPSRSAFYLILHPDDRERVEQAIDRHLQEHTPLHVECRLQHKTQSYRWFLMTGQAIWSSAGPARRLITSFMDIDARKQAEQMKSEFVSTVAHELRTPLTSIVGALGLMRSKVMGELTEKGDRLVAIAQDNCERLVSLINDLLDVEKIESGKIAFDFEAESLAHLLRVAEEQNALYAEQNGATIELEPLDHDVKVEVDKARFAQVMANLLSNAAKYSPPGGKITVAAQASDRSVRISVRDRGPGIPAAFRDRIFQRFTQANDSGQKKGTGLGLSIAKAIVEAHGGTIGFDTGEGTRHHLLLRPAGRWPRRGAWRPQGRRHGRGRHPDGQFREGPIGAHPACRIQRRCARDDLSAGGRYLRVEYGVVLPRRRSSSGASGI